MFKRVIELKFFGRAISNDEKVEKESRKFHGCYNFYIIVFTSTVSDFMTESYTNAYKPTTDFLSYFRYDAQVLL